MDYKEYQENLEKKHHAEISRLAKLNGKGIAINPKLYQKYDVKRGLRDITHPVGWGRVPQSFRMKGNFMHPLTGL